MGDLRSRLCPTGIRVDRLRSERRALAERLNELAGQCGSLETTLAAARETAHVAVAGQDKRVVAWERERVLRRRDDDVESRQLLYVSLTRGRKQILAHGARGQVPPICARIGLT